MLIKILILLKIIKKINFGDKERTNPLMRMMNLMRQSADKFGRWLQIWPDSAALGAPTFLRHFGTPFHFIPLTPFHHDHNSHRWGEGLRRCETRIFRGLKRVN